MLFGARGVGGRAERQSGRDGLWSWKLEVVERGALSPGAEADGLGCCGDERS